MIDGYSLNRGLSAEILVSFATLSASYASSPSLGFLPLRATTLGGFGVDGSSVRGFFVVFVLGEAFGLDFFTVVPLAFGV